MNETVFQYVKRFYIRAKHEIGDVYGQYITLGQKPPQIDKFFENWTINFLKNNGSVLGEIKYNLHDGRSIDSLELYRLVQEDCNKGLFTRDDDGANVRYNITDAGRFYIEFKMEL